MNKSLSTRVVSYVCDILNKIDKIKIESQKRLI